MIDQLIIPDSVAKDVKRLDKPVQRALRDNHFPRIKENPLRGDQLHGPLKGLRSYHFTFSSTQYRIAYEILEKQNAVLLLMIGKRGEFYDALMRRLGLW